MTHEKDAERADCPVCGGKPFIRRSHDPDGMRWSHVECKGCGLRTRGKWVASSSDECPIYFQEVWDEWPRRAPAAPVPQGWIDPNDKAQKQYLPHIGERVLFKHDGRVYLGKHTGGSFKAEYPFGKTFGTWDCMWMYPSALDAAAPQPPEAAEQCQSCRTGSPYACTCPFKTHRNSDASCFGASQAQRVPLSKRKIRQIDAHSGLDAIEFARAIERAHGIGKDKA